MNGWVIRFVDIQLRQDNSAVTAHGTKQCLNLHLAEAVLPDGNVWCNTILTVVQENNPKK